MCRRGTKDGATPAYMFWEAFMLMALSIGRLIYLYQYNILYFSTFRYILCHNHIRIVTKKFMDDHGS